MSEILVAVDGGATRTRAIVFDRQGLPLAEAAGGPSNHLTVCAEVVRRSLEEAIDGALEGCGAARSDVVLVSAGLAGVDYNGAGEADARRILGEAGFERSAVFGDMVIAHAGALGGHPGVLALAGTGAVFLGRTALGNWAKAGGWGYLFGDEGSAYWIGRMAVAAAARAHDGRGPDTMLLETVCRELGISGFSHAVEAIYGRGVDARGFAALSTAVHEAAELGDRVAGEILDQAGDELALGAQAILRRLDFDAAEVSWQGAVLEHCRRVRERFVETLTRTVPGVRITPPARTPVYGAWILGCRSLGWEVPSREGQPMSAPLSASSSRSTER